ncbi:hypothetical protein JOC37_000930 [Desulfohalotomaculum tongense]|uniref:hypothetical protein n=1 Tax=Desulforadius tongensis TaxID=1216062 RepID=UPI00195777B6|nr:hypothetical protein [Desulforadius tongensis]MBM7854557.1 hypothetical protein [Desulforadius tongensis]
MSSKLKKGIAALLAGTLLAGCSMSLSPNELVKHPKMEVNQQEIKQAVERFLPQGAKLTIPLRPEKASAFEQVDLNGDGSDELVAFYKKGQDILELGILILGKEEEQWTLLDNIEEPGQSIEYAEFHNITGDKAPELVVGWSGGSGMNSELSVYTLQNKKMKQLMRKNCADFSVGDLDGDLKADIAVFFRTDKEVLPYAVELPYAVVQLYRYVDGKLKMTNEMEYEAVYPDRVTIGNATKDKRGIFVDVVAGAHSAYTQLLMLENGRFKNMIGTPKGDFPITFKAYPLPSQDIDNDGIIEIGMMTEPPGTENLAMVDIPWVNVWYKWNEGGGLIPVAEDYSDWEEGYRFKIPGSWKDKYTVREVTGDDGKVQSVDFYYTGRDKKEMAKLFSIRYVAQEKWLTERQRLYENNVSYTVLRENGKNILIGVLPGGNPDLAGSDLKEYRKMQLNQESIKQLFQSPLSNS